jgi:hypothetical protein
MRLYNQPHRFYAGIDLHARSMFTHVLDAKGKTVFEHDLPARLDDRALHERSGRGPGKSLRTDGGLDSSGCFTGPMPSPCGGRVRRFAWPVGRHGGVSEAPPPTGGSRLLGRGGGRTS